MNIVLERWNELASEAAATEVLPCCGSWAWARALAARRPFLEEAEMLAASDAVWWGLGERDWREAFASHPRIGERHAAGAATAQSLAWSGQEQSAAAIKEGRIARWLAGGNRAYEARFGRTFIVCAEGKNGLEILKILNDRMANDDQVEMREAAEQQRLITHLRLARWMGVE